MNILICGGVKSGKSSYGEELISKLASNETKYYIATMIEYDQEDHNRILKHQENRKNKGFNTIELFYCEDIKDAISKSNYILDSLTALVLNELFKNEDKNNDYIFDIFKSNFEQILKNNKNMVIVADYIFSNCEHFSDFTNNYLELFGRILRYLASKCDVVFECVNGVKNILKGDL